MITKGIFYVATGDKFVREACTSAETVKEHMPDVHITGYFDKAPDVTYFDDIKIIEEPMNSFADKIPPFLDPPYDYNIFIDTDTICLEDFSDLFSVLDYYDMGVAHCVIKDCAPELDIAPDWFPEQNTGLVVFKKGATKKFFTEWDEKHEEYKKIKGPKFQNQPAFRYCLLRTDLKWIVIPREYNLRPVHGWLASGHARVKILHGRGYPMRKALKNVNKVTRKYKGDHLKPRVGDLTMIERIWWGVLRKLGLDDK